MKCKYCTGSLPDGAVFCCWCGERQRRERKKKNEISVPKARLLPSGKWNIQLRAEGLSITEDTEALCVARARAVRAGFIELKKNPQSISLSAAIDNYIEKNRASLSPSTIRGYIEIKNGHFARQMSLAVGSKTDWQAVIDKELEHFSLKTMKNAWAFVSMILKQNGVQPPVIKFPQKVLKERPWLDYEQIALFLEAVRDDPCETAALLALHSLRRSEVLGLMWANVDLKNNTITVSGSRVEDENGNYVYKETNKNVSSQRTVPIVIPRLRELLEVQSAGADPARFVVTLGPEALYKRINRVCEKAALPKVGCHGLRHSFASLGYHLQMSELEIMELGGWSEYQTVHKIYTHLAKQDRLHSTNKMAEFYASAASDEAEPPTG